MLRAILFTAVLTAGAISPAIAAPDHLVLMVFDQMRPEYVDRFDLKNFKRLRGQSVHYPEAFLGHMASVTIVGHLALPTGLLPRDLPWNDGGLWDKRGILGKKDALYDALALPLEQHMKLMGTIADRKYVHWAVKQKYGGKAFAVGNKDYAAVAMGGPPADGIVTLKKGKDGVCRPWGRQVPTYISANPRFTVDCKNKHGTEDLVYPVNGVGVPGKDPARLGGDVWVGDAAAEIMGRENWSTLLLTFAGIDKIAHALGEQTGAGPHGHVPAEFRLADIARAADAQLGKILDLLERSGLTSRTVVAVTSDHGGAV